MKRLAVLFGILAFVFACGTAYATAPQVRDMPNLRLSSGDGASGLALNATEAYNVMDFFLDVDDAPTALTVSILGVQMLQGDNPAPNVYLDDIDSVTTVTGAEDVLVSVFGHATAGWAQYTVEVTDASTSSKGVGGDAAIQDAAIAKYSTFALGAPSIDDGVVLRTGGENAATRQFVYCYMGQDGELLRLDVAIDPAEASASLDWEVYVSDVIANSTPETFDDNGSFTGVAKQHVASGADVSVGGLNYSIDAEGCLRLTSGGAVSPGPWLVGILAVNQADADDSDGSRILVASAMLAEASPDTATIGGSVTLDDLEPATLDEAVDFYISTLNDASRGNNQPVGGASVRPYENNIAPGCHWTYLMSGTDTFIDSVPLEIVDLETDSDLPAAAQIWEGDNADTAQIAGGMGIKAVLATPVGPFGARGLVAGTNQLDGFRLTSRAFTGIEPTDIITFACSIATDAADATDVPKYQLYAGSGFFGAYIGKDMRILRNVVNLVDGPGATQPHLDMPTADEGWHTLSCTYAPAATIQWFNLNGDSVMDEADLDLLRAEVAPEGWDGGNEMAVVKAGILVTTQQQCRNDVKVWVDNLRVYRSAFALDLALGNEELTDMLAAGENEQLDAMVAAGGMEIPTGDLDGTIESAVGSTHADLSAIGLIDGFGAGTEGAFRYAEMQYIDGPNSLVSLGSYDHTRNAGSDQCLRVVIAGDDGADGWAGALDAFRYQVATGAAAAMGDGIYAFEAYVAKLNTCNVNTSYRHPQVRVILNEVGPNYLATNTGYILSLGGLPDSVQGDPPYNWLRCVAEMYIPNATMVRGIFQIMDTFKADASMFGVPIFIDDAKLYKVGDAAQFFDADLFDGV